MKLSKKQLYRICFRSTRLNDPGLAQHTDKFTVAQDAAQVWKQKLNL